MRADYDAERTRRVSTRPAPFAELTRAMRAWAEASRDEPADDLDADPAPPCDHQPNTTESR